MAECVVCVLILLFGLQVSREGRSVRRSAERQERVRRPHSLLRVKLRQWERSRARREEQNRIYTLGAVDTCNVLYFYGRMVVKVHLLSTLSLF